MGLSFSTIMLGLMCIAFSVVYVAARWKNNGKLAAGAKVIGSTLFIALAIVNGAAATAYGQMILIGLILSWLGDLFLLSLKKTYLLAGIAAFFLAHFAFGGAFALKPLNGTAAVVASGAVVLSGALLLRWLWKHLKKSYKIAVPLYLAAIGVMVVLAVAASAATLPIFVAAGAMAFAVSDVSVARDRFVERSLANKVWGIPLYYTAQVLLAASVHSG